MTFLEDILKSMSAEGVDIAVVGLLMGGMLVLGFMLKQLADRWSLRHPKDEADDSGAEPVNGLANPKANQHRISVLEQDFRDHKSTNHSEHVEMMEKLGKMQSDVTGMKSDLLWIREHIQGG